MSTTDDVLAQIDEAIEDWAVGPDAMRCGAPHGVGLASLQRLTFHRTDPAAIAATSARINAAFQDFAKGMAKIARAFNAMVESNPHIRRLLGLPIYDRHHPRPLCIDGVAYHRRRNARRRRR